MQTPKTPEQRETWATYNRLRKHPQKSCTRCKTIFPNTKQYFAISAHNKLRSTCIECARLEYARQNLLAKIKGSATVSMCPICDEYNALVIDRVAPSPQALCRRCLALINMAGSLVKVSPTLFVRRLIQYLEWRQKSPGQV